jgi:hypothetical protein
MSTSRHTAMGRREFLKTSTCALATAAVGPQLFAGLASQPKLMVAGFASLEIESAGTDVFTANVIDARRAPADAAFLRHGARISSYGLSGADPRHQRALDFQAHYAVGSGKDRRFVPYYAWVAGGRSDGARPVSFNVPVDGEQKIRFSMTAKMPAPVAGAATSRRGLLASRETAVEPRAIPVELGLRGGAGSLELARGFYVIVPVYDGVRTPQWSSYSLRRTAGQWVLHEAHGAATLPVEFEHFVVRVDYAKA